ncbi:hypothetical protein BDZ45DRAFT_281375 [Acephala macrosclerotiorum]|nr:hypothetical protein BDZ45DRAFT_281375 [Acephala macrosclerotiorum]
MPLLTKMLPLRETAEDLQAVASLHSQHQQQKENRSREKKDCGYDDFQEYNDDECLSSDMEGSIVHRGRPKKVVRAPAIPARNEKRASKILESVVLELKTLDGTSTKDADSRSMVQESDPHESYLSSEEDASFSDDYEDSLTSSEDNLEDSSSPVESFSRTTRRRSQEDTARVVSFICVGKPQIVDIFIPSNHTSPIDVPMKRHSMNLDALTSLTQAPAQQKSTRRPAPLKLYPSSTRRMSISSLTSSHTSSSNSTAPTNYSSTNLSNSNNGALPPRKSSRLAQNLTSLVTNTKSTFSTSHSNYSGCNLARIPSESHLVPEQKQQNVDVRSRSSVYSSQSNLEQIQQASEHKDTGVRRAETFAGLPSPRLIPDSQSQQENERKSIMYDGVMHVPPPVPTDSAHTTTSGRRSFSFASGISGLGRRKSVKAK